jgi:hypothetical protein
MRLLTILSLLLCNTFVSAGTSLNTDSTTSVVLKTKRLGMSVGALNVKDIILIPKVHRGYIIDLSYGRIRIKENRLSSYHFDIGYSRGKTRIEDLPASVFINILFQYDHSFKLKSTNSLSYYLGPSLRLNYILAAYPMWDDSHMYWGNYASLGIQNTLLWTLNNSKLYRLKIEMPLFSLSSRPPSVRQYKIDDLTFNGIMNNFNSNLQAGTLDKVFFLSAELDYQFPLSAKRKESIGYAFQYLTVDSRDNKPLQTMYNMLTLKYWF